MSSRPNGRYYSPISRYYNFGFTFRWIRGDNFIAVKPGYVCEGQAFIARAQPKNYTIQDRPGDNPYSDEETWIACIPVNSDKWDDDEFFVKKTHEWAFKTPDKVDLKDRTDIAHEKGLHHGLRSRFSTCSRWDLGMR